jgi:TolB-like protein/DNA-binding winged helix-turn-helix (wHTH) protein/lipopolysaccharide biosynthesis regulator YciM
LLDPDRRLIVCNGGTVHLAHKPFQVLLYLVENRDRVVTRQELLESFWDGKDVYDDTLRKSVGAIRKALGDRLGDSRFIETRHREGYRYVGPFEESVVDYPPSEFEIEKTRGVRIIVEEEDSQPPQAQVAATGVQDAAEIMTRRRLPSVTVALILAAVALGTIALSIYRGQAEHTSNQPRTAPVRSVAVMPLMNLSGDPANEYFTDGLTETFITELSRIRELKVISRGSAFTFKGKDVDPRDVGRRLGVEAVLEGSVRRSGNTVRVETKLVSTDDGRVIWAGNTFDHNIKDIFVVQDEIGCSVAASLRLTLCGEQGSQVSKRYTENVDAYEALLKSRYFYNKRTAEGLRKAIEYSEQAIKLDPLCAMAHAQLAGDYLMSIWFTPTDPKQVSEKAKAAATRALELDDTFAEAHEVMASIFAYGGNWQKSNDEWQRVFELNPAYSEYGYAYQLLRRDPDEAVRWMKRAAELDPLSLLVSTNVGQILYYARRYDEAIEQLKLVLELDPSYVMAHTYLGQTYLEKRMYDEAIEEFQRSISLSEQGPEMNLHLGYAYAAAGKQSDAQKLLVRLFNSPKETYVSPYMIARIYAGLGTNDRAFDMLEKAYQQRDSHIVDLLYDPALDAIRSDARYLNLLGRLGLTEENTSSSAN